MSGEVGILISLWTIERIEDVIVPVHVLDDFGNVDFRVRILPDQFLGLFMVQVEHIVACKHKQDDGVANNDDVDDDDDEHDDDADDNHPLS